MECLDENAVAELFDDALPEPARAAVDAHLDVCPGCRAVVSALALELSGPALPVPPALVGPTGDVDEDLHAGDVVGRYAVLECIGVGSMGIVYGAYDPNLDRRVALKILRGRAQKHDREAALREAQSMGRLNHPNIVAVHDVGASDGRIFIAMEYVAGPTLRAWQRSESRSWRETVGVYVGAGRGLAAAHAAGVVHRDFKPDNVLVGDDGRARVTDFGLAAVKTIVTGPSTDPGPDATGVVGTPRYMAPEQHLGQPATPASDQFAFCVALHEALYGEPPFAGDTPSAIERAVSAGEIRSAPVASTVPAAIRKLVAEGLSAQEERRHSSMLQLLDRLDTAARPRRRAMLAAGGLGVAAAAAAIYVATSSASPCDEVRLDEVWSAAAQQRLADAIKADDAPYAEQTSTGVSARLSAYAESWTEFHRESCEAARVRRTLTAEDHRRRMNCLERRRIDLAALVEVLTDGGLSSFEGAVDAAARLPPVRACADVEGPGSAPADDITARLAHSRARVNSGDFARALADAEAIAGAATDDASAAEALLTAGYAQTHLAVAEAAETTLHRALARAEAAGADALRHRAMTLLVFAVGYRQARYDEGLRWGTLAKALADRVPPTPADDARRMRYRGLLHHEQGRFETAESFHQRALERLRTADAVGHPEYAKALAGLADSVMAQRRYKEAEALFREALARETKSLGQWHPRIANAAHGLGNVLEFQGRKEAAQAEYRRALEIHDAIHGRQHPDVAGDLLALGRSALTDKDLDAAEVALEEALSIQEGLGRGDHPRTAAMLEALAGLRDAQGNTEDALSLQQRAVAVEERVRPDHPSAAVALYNLGVSLLEVERASDAVPVLMRASKIAEAALGQAEPLVVLSLAVLGEAQTATGDAKAGALSLARARAARAAYAAADPDPSRLEQIDARLAHELDPR